MPEGYKCDQCDEFSEYTHNMTEIEVGLAAAQDGSRYQGTYVICPECATDLREWIRDIDISQKAREDVL